MAQNNLTEKHIDADIQTTLKHAPAQKLTKEKIDSLHISCIIALFSFTTLLESVFHGYSVLVLTPKVLGSVTFVHITTSAQALF